MHTYQAAYGTISRRLLAMGAFGDELADAVQDALAPSLRLYTRDVAGQVHVRIQIEEAWGL